MSYYPPQQHRQQQQQYGGWYGGPPQPPADPFRAWYAEQLATLTFNSRPIIQGLSVEAMKQRDQHNWAGMQAVVEEIEQAVLRAAPPHKLPILYLIDSISKNCGPPYTDQLLPPILPRLYLRAYREVDGVTKSKMEEMLKLWRTGGPGGTELYPPGVREAVERDIFGSTAPLTQQGVQGELRHFLREKEEEMAKEFSTGLAKSVNVLVQIDQLLSSQQVSPQELVDIKNRLNAMKGGQMPTSANLKRASPAVPTPPPVSQNFQPRAAHPPYPPPTQSYQPPRQDYPPYPQALNVPLAVPTPPLSVTPTPAAPTPIPAIPTDVADILRNLSSSGVLSQPRTPEPTARKTGLDAYQDMILALDMRVDVFDLTKLSLPMSHLPVRCKQCGERFPEGENKLQAHMDWHFRRNRKERETEGRGAHRKWLPRANVWVHENEEAGPSEPKPAATTTKLTNERLAALKRKWVRAPSDPAKATTPCPICKEQFKSEWSEDEEEWVFMNAINVNGTIYHATCRAEKMSSAVAARLLGNERAASKSPVPDAARSTVPSPASSVAGSPVKSPAPLPRSPTTPGSTKRKAEDDAEGDDAKRVKVEPEENSGGAEAPSDTFAKVGEVPAVPATEASEAEPSKPSGEDPTTASDAAGKAPALAPADDTVVKTEPPN